VASVGRKTVLECVNEFMVLNNTARSVEEYSAKLEPLLRTPTFCPDCSAEFVFNDSLQCNDADRSYEFFCPQCGTRFTGIKTSPQTG
jgi:hypothetical protein